MNNFWIVYKHTSPSNKHYIGITSQNINQRWRNGSGYIGQPIMENAIKKYGWDNFSHEILYENLSEEEAKNKEKELIKLYHSYYLDPLGPGYNMTMGGEGLSTIDWDIFLKLYREGKNMSEIARITNHNINTIGAALHKMDKTIPFGVDKKVNQFTLNGEYIATFKNCSEADKAYNLSSGVVSRVARGKQKTAANFQWRFYNEEDLKGIPPIERHPGKRTDLIKKKSLNSSF